jgi:hypothetical protein
MRIIFVLSTTVPVRLIFAKRIASPMAVPESHGRDWMMLLGEIFQSTDLIPTKSSEKGMERNGFPANMISHMLFFSPDRSVSIAFLALSIRFGRISSASMDLDTSRRMRVFFAVSGRVVYLQGEASMPTMRKTKIARNIQSMKKPTQK